MVRLKSSRRIHENACAGGSCRESFASNSIDFLAYAEEREADLVTDRVFSLLRQRCAICGVGEETEGLECEQVEINV